jgi:outer membrane protein assembly factor BamB
VVKAHDFSGKEVWSVSPGEFHSIHGFCATPVLYRDLVILNCDQDADAYIVALERKTGKEAWRADRENKLRSYCPPLIFEAGGRTQMALSGSKTISSYDPLTGRRLWVCDGPTEQCVASLVHGSGLVFVTGGYPDREILAIDPTGSGDVTATHVRWRSPKGVAYVPSPVYHDGHFFVVSDTGVLSAIEARTGEYRGQKRLDGNFSASLLIAASHLYAFSEEGIVHVFRAGPGIEPGPRIDMGETIFATPAALPGMLLLRTSKRLVAIRGRAE